MALKKFLLTWLAFQVMLFATAQKKDRIETDRPNESELADLVPKRYFQIESGIYSEKKSETEKDVVHPHTLLRYGMAEWIELRILINFSTLREKMIPSDKISTGLEPVAPGVKISLLKQKNIIPATSLLLHAGIPSLASKDFKAKHLAPEVRLLMENSLSDNIELTYNAGVEWDGFEKDPSWLYSISPGFDIGERFEAFIEAYGYFNKHEAAQHTIDGGIEFFVNKDFAVDICSGFGLNKSASNFFVTFGGSIRFR